MTDPKFAKQAFEECTSDKTTAHHGGAAGRPFWNIAGYQFMYTPAFHFTRIPGCYSYRYTAVDETGKTHTFDADNSEALLTPIWKDIPEGVVSLTVTSLDKEGNPKYPVGARTFFKLASFPADLPDAARPYGEAAKGVYDFAMSQNFIKHWLTDGTPDPEYNLYVYPSKMDSAVINAMINYARMVPEKAEDALKVACAAADYMISKTPGEDSPMNGVPLTYQVDFRPNPEKHSNATAMDRINRMMMIYPAHMGTAYMNLEKATGNEKYLEAARKIGNYYRDHVCENGSWHLIVDKNTGESLSPNFTEPLERIVPFLMALYERTGEQQWKTLADGAIHYVETDKLKTYEWEAQFEDTSCSINYSNLTHYGACALVRYYCKYFSDNAERMERAEDLIRFVEDQFVLWKRPAPWNKQGRDTSTFGTPCGLEQYVWHYPIDASTSDIMLTFLAMYKAGRGDLYLEKARALGDMLTRVQQPSGMIPTGWDDMPNLANDSFWLNCLFVSADALAEMAEYYK